MVDYGVKKTSKGVKQRTDEDKTGKQTRDRRRSDGKKNMDDIHRPYLIQRVLATPLFKIQRSRFGCSPTLYTLPPTPYAKYSRIFLSKVSRISCCTCLQRSSPAMPPPRSLKNEWRELLRNCMICCTSRE